MVTRTTLEVTVKNTVAQITKEFYGYGPRTSVRCVVYGPLILHVTRTVGSAILDELAARPAGQVVLQYNNQLLVDKYRDRLAGLARLALSAEVTALFSDFDPASRLIVGGALLNRPLNRDHRPAGAKLASIVRQATAASGGPEPAEVESGPNCFWTRIPAAGWAPAAGQDAVHAREDYGSALADLARWRAWRDRLTGSLRDQCERAGIRPEATFAGVDQGLVILGGVLPG